MPNLEERYPPPPRPKSASLGTWLMVIGLVFGLSFLCGMTFGPIVIG